MQVLDVEQVNQICLEVCKQGLVPRLDASLQILLHLNCSFKQLFRLEQIDPWGQTCPQALQQQQPDLHTQACTPLRLLLQSISALAMVLYERSLVTGVDHRHPFLLQHSIR